MSFKRDKDDPAAFKQIQKRQVSHLLIEDIPEDEARLERNGKYLCLVCAHKPIVDTVTMLAIHRQGQGHIYWQERFYQNKQELEHLKQKRAHEQYLKTGTPTCPVNAVHVGSNVGKRHPLLNSKAYNPRSKKTGKKPKLYDRRQILDLEDEGEEEPLDDEQVCNFTTYARLGSTMPNVTGTSRDANFVKPKAVNMPAKADRLPSENNPQKALKITKDAKTIQDFIRIQKQQKLREPMFIRPYGSKTFIPRKHSQPVSLLQKESSLWDKNTSETLPLTQPIEATLETANVIESRVPANNHNSYSPVSSIQHQTPFKGVTNRCEYKVSSFDKIDETLTSKVPVTSDSSHVVVAAISACVSSTNNRTEDQTQYLEKYRKAIESGWVKTKGGEWIRDPNVEFDSDDDEPNL